MAFEYSKILDTMKEFPAIFNMNTVINPATDAGKLEQDLFIGTSTEAGIVRREKEYGIEPKDTDTLEDRRFRLKAKENERLPYTERVLMEKLETLCGAGGYTLEICHDKVSVKVALNKKNFYETIADMLEKVIPLNMIIRLNLLYNTYDVLSQKTCNQLQNYTYQQLRDEVM